MAVPHDDVPIMGRVLAIAVRSGKNEPMRELTEAAARAGGGIEGDLHVSPRRGITFISRRQWDEVNQDLKTDLPWHTRRANVLVEGLDLAALMGLTVRLGEAEVELLGETEPCSNMDRIHQGLRRALTPDFRGGVHGRVLRGGQFKIGDPIEVMSNEPVGQRPGSARD